MTLDTHSSDYITEKVYEVLEAGAVPVYLGAPNWQDCECPSKSAHTHTHTHTCLRAHVCVTGFWLLLPLSPSPPLPAPSPCASAHPLPLANQSFRWREQSLTLGLLIHRMTSRSFSKNWQLTTRDTRCLCAPVSLYVSMCTHAYACTLASSSYDPQRERARQRQGGREREGERDLLGR